MKAIVNSRYVKTITMIMVAATLMVGCKISRTAKGGAIGAGAGGAIGGVIGSQSGNTAKGAILGAAIGGAAGALIGNYMDKQAEELQDDLEGAEVERVGEGIKITFDSGILFDVDSYSLRSASKRNLKELADVLQKYDETEVLIEGHTDSTGPEEYNQTLSENRAQTVKAFLDAEGVKGARLITVGYGESQPVASNKTTAGRQDNRRVEVAIYANDKLKRAAKRGDI
jgi:outer membrane protein OmpA-like peptidoglycan-associated protein